MTLRARYGLAIVAFALLSACNRSDTDMQEAFWCSSYGTCKPTAVGYHPKAAAAVDTTSFCSYYGNCEEPQPRMQNYDNCAFYGICDRGS